MFPPEKISPDSLLEGEYMLDGMFVFFICSLSRHRLFIHLSPPFPARFTMMMFDLLPLFITLWLFLLSLLLFVSLLFPSCLCVSALCLVAEESRLGPSNVSAKVAPQLAACPTRGLSLLGLATHTSALPLPLLRHNAQAGSQLLDRPWKVNSSDKFNQFHFLITMKLQLCVHSLVWGWFSAFYCFAFFLFLSNDK